MAGVVDGTVPSWQRSPLAAIKPAGPPQKQKQKPKSRTDTNARSFDSSAVVGANNVFDSNHHSKRVLEFIQKQHSEAMGSLREEIKSLKAENRDLKFRLVMRDSEPAAGLSDEKVARQDVDPTIAYEKRVQEVRELQQKVEAEQMRRSDLEFDLRSEIRILRSTLSEIDSQQRAVEPNEAKLNQANLRYKSKLATASAEIDRLREELNALKMDQSNSGGGGGIPFATRGYVHKLDNIRNSSNQAARSDASDDGGGHQTDQQLQNIIETRKSLRNKNSMHRQRAASTSELPSFGTEWGAAVPLPALSITVMAKSGPKRGSIGHKK